MATGLSGLADAVMCSICLESFVEARVLPCVHSFCTKCLEDLVDEQQMITCPECRQEFHVCTHYSYMCRLWFSCLLPQLELRA